MSEEPQNQEPSDLESQLDDLLEQIEQAEPGLLSEPTSQKTPDEPAISDDGIISPSPSPHDNPAVDQPASDSESILAELAMAQQEVAGGEIDPPQAMPEDAETEAIDPQTAEGEAQSEVDELEQQAASVLDTDGTTPNDQDSVEPAEDEPAGHNFEDQLDSLLTSLEHRNASSKPADTPAPEDTTPETPNTIEHIDSETDHDEPQEEDAAQPTEDPEPVEAPQAPTLNPAEAALADLTNAMKSSGLLDPEPADDTTGSVEHTDSAEDDTPEQELATAKVHDDVDEPTTSAEDVAIDAPSKDNEFSLSNQLDELLNQVTEVNAEQQEKQASAEIVDPPAEETPDEQAPQENESSAIESVEEIDRILADHAEQSMADQLDPPSAPANSSNKAPDPGVLYDDSTAVSGPAPKPSAAEPTSDTEPSEQPLTDQDLAEDLPAAQGFEGNAKSVADELDAELGQLVPDVQELDTDKSDVRPPRWASWLALLNKPLAGLNPVTRDAIGYIALLHLFTGTALIVGRLVGIL